MKTPQGVGDLQDESQGHLQPSLMIHIWSLELTEYMERSLQITVSSICWTLWLTKPPRFVKTSHISTGIINSYIPLWTLSWPRLSTSLSLLLDHHHCSLPHYGVLPSVNFLRKDRKPGNYGDKEENPGGGRRLPSWDPIWLLRKAGGEQWLHAAGFSTTQSRIPAREWSTVDQPSNSLMKSISYCVPKGPAPTGF